jgi:2-methylisocitrate lyase-like PEP mutase family enzyme
LRLPVQKRTPDWLQIAERTFIRCGPATPVGNSGAMTMDAVNLGSPGARLRALLNQPGIVISPGVFDGFSLRLVELMGYKTAAISGAGLSESNLGWSDVGIMGYAENLRASAALAAISSIPLSADGDTGYGNALNVYFTVQGFERAGLACLMIEDQVWPKRCGHMEGKRVISAEEAVEKIRAAAEARRDPDFVIKARTDATAIHGVGEAIRRLNLYAEAGADLLFADALLTAEDIATVARNVVKPLTVNMGFGIRQRPTTPLLSTRQLEDMGVKAVSFPRLLTAAAIQGMKNALAVLGQSIEEGRAIDRPDLLVSFDELNDLMGIREIRALERSFVAPSGS